VFLLTSHPIAPPWNSGDKNLARTLLLGSSGVDYVFIGDRSDYTPWPEQHRRVALGFTSDAPTVRQKLRLLWWLVRSRPAAEMVHAVVTFRSVMAQRAVMHATAIERMPLVLTCPSGAALPVPLIRRARAVVALSERTASALCRAGAPLVRVIPPGVDLVRFRPESTVAARGVLGVAHRPTILFAGHHDPGGGLEAALTTAARLRRGIPELQVLLAMRLRPGEVLARQQAAVDRWSAQLGLAGTVVQLGPYANMRAALHASDVVIFQPATMGAKMELPMTLLEALACGRPVVTSKAAPLPEIADGSAAVFVGDSGAAATDDHVSALLTDRAAHTEAAAAARALAERRFAAGEMVTAYADLYADLAA
ncbi:MAG: glycosyltransferase family 4 protein, partial [Chloroflexi bacterium]